MSRVRLALVFSFLLGVATHAAVATEVLHDVEQRPLNLAAIAMFLVFAVAQTRSMGDFYTTGGGITGFQNGMALAGDYMSAAALLGVSTLLAVLALCMFGFSLNALFEQAVAAHKNGMHILVSSKLVSDPIALFSLAIGLVFGTAGLPHIFMRFFTVPDAKEARKSVFVTTGVIGFFFLVIMVLGMAAIAIVGRNPSFYVGGLTGGKLIGGSNMSVMHLAQALGRNLLFGFLSAVAVATILAVASGLRMAGTSAISHDLNVMALKRNRADPASERRVSRIASVCFGVVAVLLGIVFKDQNIAFLVALTFGVAASMGFPILAPSMCWKGLTTRGALTGGIAGLVSSVTLLILSPAIWVTVLGHANAIFPYDYPAIVSMTIAFLFAWLGSITDRSYQAQRELDDFDEQATRARSGYGTSGAVSH